MPRSIEEEEIAPKGAAYMARNDMERRDGRIVQRSGPRNSLGLVKFDMQNEHAIYLHDTPAKALFGEDERHASHGCVRVHDALGFAAPDRRPTKACSTSGSAPSAGDEDEEEQYEEAFVALPRPIPVRLLYHTALVEDGRVVIAPDAYGWDDEVARALGLPAGPRRAAQRRDGISVLDVRRRERLDRPRKARRPRMKLLAFAFALTVAAPAAAQTQTNIRTMASTSSTASIKAMPSIRGTASIRTTVSTRTAGIIAAIAASPAPTAAWPIAARTARMARTAPAASAPTTPTDCAASVATLQIAPDQPIIDRPGGEEARRHRDQDAAPERP